MFNIFSDRFVLVAEHYSNFKFFNVVIVKKKLIIKFR